MKRLLVALVCAALAAPLPVNAGSVSLLGAGKTVSAATCSFTRIDFTTGSLGTASLSRASANATYINSSGILTTAGTNVARFNFDANYPRGNASPLLTGPYLLVEPAATNLLKQSNSFANSTWPPNNGGVATAGALTSPDGTADGWSLTAGTGFGGVGQAITFSNVQYTFGAWSSNITGFAAVLFQLDTVNGGDIFLGNTFVRHSSALTPAAVASGANIYTDDAAGNVNGLFGAQLELGAHATSYIATTTTTATRAADVVTFTQPVGCGHNTYTFDDNSTQVVTQAPGAATVPTNLNRPNIKFIDGSA